jgi:hypothetical protein
MPLNNIREHVATEREGEIVKFYHPFQGFHIQMPGFLLVPNELAASEASSEVYDSNTILIQAANLQHVHVVADTHLQQQTYPWFFFSHCLPIFLICGLSVTYMILSKF